MCSVREAGRKLAAFHALFFFCFLSPSPKITLHTGTWNKIWHFQRQSPLCASINVFCLSRFVISHYHSCRPTLALPRGHSNSNKTPGSHLYCSRKQCQEVNLWFYWTKTPDNDELFCLFGVIPNPDLALVTLRSETRFYECCVTFSNVIEKNFDLGES